MRTFAAAGYFNVYMASPMAGFVRVMYSGSTLNPSAREIIGVDCIGVAIVVGIGRPAADRIYGEKAADAWDVAPHSHLNCARRKLGAAALRAQPAVFGVTAC